MGGAGASSVSDDCQSFGTTHLWHANRINQCPEEGCQVRAGLSYPSNEFLFLSLIKTTYWFSFV